MTRERDREVTQVVEATTTRAGVTGRGRCQRGQSRARKLNARGETLLHIAARLNKTSDVVTLLVEGAHVNARDYAGLCCANSACCC